MIRAVEPASCPSLTRGVYAYDFGDTAGMTPLLKMHTLGHDFIPDPIHAGGLRYHGMWPLLSHVYELGLIEAWPCRRPSASPRGAVRPDRGDRPRARSRPTPSPRASGRRWPARSPARRRSSSPPCAGTGTSTWRAYDAYLGGRMVDEDVPDERFAEALSRPPRSPPALTHASHGQLR